MPAPPSVDAYFATLTDRQRRALTELRAVIRSVVPEATEAISYQMPAFRAHGRAVVGYAAFRDHYSLFPMGPADVEGLEALLAPYRAGKGTIRFSYDEPLPVDVVQAVVAERLAQNEARARR